MPWLHHLFKKVMGYGFFDLKTVQKTGGKLGIYVFNRHLFPNCLGHFAIAISAGHHVKRLVDMALCRCAPSIPEAHKAIFHPGAINRKYRRTIGKNHIGTVSLASSTNNLAVSADVSYFYNKYLQKLKFLAFPLVYGLLCGGFYAL